MMKRMNYLNDFEREVFELLVEWCFNEDELVRAIEESNERMLEICESLLITHFALTIDELFELYAEDAEEEECIW